jgi:C1A family cysteine protease
MIFTIICAVAFANNLHLNDLETSWKKWNQQYSTSATVKAHGIDADRKEIFAYNYAFVRMHNSRNQSFTLALNEFAAMTEEEFTQRNGFRQSERSWRSLGEEHEMATDVPDSVDWRPKLVTPIKNQGQCGSCWAFSTIVSLEGQYAKLTNDLTSFSEQDLVDCVKNVKIPGQSDTCCNGCQGGLMDYAFQYMIDSQSGSDDTESSYPYTGKQGTCSFTAGSAFKDAKVTGYVDLKSEDELKNAVGSVGPVSVAVNANIFWQLYNGGILNPVTCNANKLDHGVAAVGYGTDGSDYWIIRNSWGKSWGEEGYARLLRGSNKCGIANGPPSYPKMESA